MLACAGRFTCGVIRRDVQIMMETFKLNTKISALYITIALNKCAAVIVQPHVTRYSHF